MKYMLGIGWIAIILLVSACGKAAGSDATPAVAGTEVVAQATAALPQPSVTPPPSTEEPTAAPTATEVPPKATSEPTIEPTEAPLPVISLETLIGLFNQFDFEAGGNNWLWFYEDGTFAGRHGPEFDTGIHVTDGTYTLDGDVLTLVDPEQCPAGESYRLEYRNQTQVQFKVSGEVTCDYLAADFERQPNWKRVEK